MTDDFPYVKTCWSCDGYGYFIRFDADGQQRGPKTCGTCKGRGRVIPPEWINDGGS